MTGRDAKIVQTTSNLHHPTGIFVQGGVRRVGYLCRICRFLVMHFTNDRRAERDHFAHYLIDHQYVLIRMRLFLTAAMLLLQLERKLDTGGKLDKIGSHFIS